MTDEQHERYHRDLGAYVLGALDPRDRDAFEAHLATCHRCRDELADLAVLPAMLGRLPVPDAADDPPVPPLEPILVRIAAEQRRVRRRGSLLGAVAAAIVLVAVLAAGAVVSSLGGPDLQRYEAADRTASATVEERGWGMLVTLRAADLPDHPGYTAVAVRDDGHRAQVASWSATGAPIELQGSCYMDAGELVRIEILAGGTDEVVAVLEAA